jgi:hypothetical protein
MTSGGFEQYTKEALAVPLRLFSFRCHCEWNEPVLGRDFHPQWTSTFHGARNHQLRIYSWQSLPLWM